MTDETNAYAVKINGHGWNMALEEAAKVAGKWQQMYFEDEKVHASNITEYIVAAIRALVKEPT